MRHPINLPEKKITVENNKNGKMNLIISIPAKTMSLAKKQAAYRN
jgi:hypothetical protein